VRIFVFLITALGLTGAAAAMDREEFNSVKPEVREWFRNMRSPMGRVCCSEADGHRTQYAMRQGQYWVPINGAWYPVPPDTVIKAPNLIGEGVVWYLSNTGEYGASPGQGYQIFCFIPTDGV
jgi:hypothetical protein